MDYLRSRMRAALDDDEDDEDDKEGEEDDGIVSDQEAQARRLSFPIGLHRSQCSDLSSRCVLAYEDSNHDGLECHGRYRC